MVRTIKYATIATQYNRGTNKRILVFARVLRLALLGLHNLEKALGRNLVEALAQLRCHFLVHRLLRSIRRSVDAGLQGLQGLPRYLRL